MGDESTDTLTNSSPHKESPSLAWVRIDQKFHWHESVEPLSDAAYRLFIGGLCWCNFQETDGEITESQLHNVSQKMPKKRRADAITQLLDVGLWVKTGRGYGIKNYLKFQPSSKDLEANRNRMAELGSIGGKRRAEALRLSDTLEQPVQARPSVSSVRHDRPSVEALPILKNLNGEDLERAQGQAARLRERQAAMGFRKVAE